MCTKAAPKHWIILQSCVPCYQNEGLNKNELNKLIGLWVYGRINAIDIDPMELCTAQHLDVMIYWRQEHVWYIRLHGKKQ